MNLPEPLFYVAGRHLGQLFAADTTEASIYEAAPDRQRTGPDGRADGPVCRGPRRQCGKLVESQRAHRSSDRGARSGDTVAQEPWPPARETQRREENRPEGQRVPRE